MDGDDAQDGWASGRRAGFYDDGTGLRWWDGYRWGDERPESTSPPQRARRRLIVAGVVALTAAAVLGVAVLGRSEHSAGEDPGAAGRYQQCVTELEAKADLGDGTIPDHGAGVSVENATSFGWRIHGYVSWSEDRLRRRWRCDVDTGGVRDVAFDD